MTPKVRTNFWLDDRQREGLQLVKSKTGISEGEQIRKGIQMWLESQGVGETMQVMERLNGIGDVFRDGVLLRPMNYHLVVWQEPGGLKSIEGRVELNQSEAFDLVGVELSLKIEDGREMDFLVRSSDGKIANRNGKKGLS